MNMKQKWQRGRPKSRWEQQFRNDVTQKTMGINRGGVTYTAGDTWLSDDPLKVETSQGEEDTITILKN
jgi:hypothetical protein